MSQYQKLLYKILDGRHDKNISFSDLCFILEKLGFACHVRGDHFIFVRESIREIINIQPKNDKAKPYQVKQIRELILKYHLGGGSDES